MLLAVVGDAVRPRLASCSSRSDKVLAEGEHLEDSSRPPLTHSRSSSLPHRLRRDIPTVLTANLAEMRRVGVRTEVNADIWIDGSALVRRTVFVFSLDDGTRVRVTTAYSEFGSPLRDIPDPVEVCQHWVRTRTCEATSDCDPEET